MCEPTTIALAVVSAAGAVYQVQQQDEQAKAANKATELQYEEETARAERDSKDRQNQLTSETLQEATKFQQQRQQLALASLRESAAARVASAESGVGGVTAARSFLSEDLATGAAEADLRQSQEFTQFNIEQRARGIATSKRDRNVNADFTRVANTRRRASGLDFAFAGVQGAVSGAQAGRALGGGRSSTTTTTTKKEGSK